MEYISKQRESKKVTTFLLAIEKAIRKKVDDRDQEIRGFNEIL
jgi:hypothetical protein